MTKVCKSYPCINTSFCTNTTPTGADKANGPSHYQQLPGRKGGSLCPQLVSNNTRSMGLANNNGLPVGTDAGALSNKTKPCNTVFFRGKTQKFNIPGGTGTSGEREAQLTQGSFVSQIFLVEKKEGGLRPVVNLKNLSCFIQTEHFKMQGLHTLPDLKMDLKDAYLQIPVCQEHQHLLQFQWNATIYQFKCLPFGLTSGVYQGVKTGGRDTEKNGNSSNSIPGRHSDNASEQGGIDAVNSSNMSVLCRFRLGGQFGKITLDSRNFWGSW